MGKDVRGSAGAEGARRATEASAGRGRGGRFSVGRKTEAVLRLLRGEDLELVSRELGLTAARLSQWREQFLAGGQANLKARDSDPQAEESQRLQAKVGELLMENELLYAKVDALEGGRLPDQHGRAVHPVVPAVGIPQHPAPRVGRGDPEQQRTRNRRHPGLLMAFKLLTMAERRWRRVNAPHLVPLVRAGVRFHDGVTVERVARTRRAA